MFTSVIVQGTPPSVSMAATTKKVPGSIGVPPICKSHPAQQVG
jgi:hypothetical protein